MVSHLYNSQLIIIYYMVSHLYNISFIFLTSPFMVDFIVCIRVIRVIRSTDHPLCSFVIMSFCLQKNHLSPFVIMSFCLKNLLCLHLSTCYSVSQIFCLYRVEKSWQWCV